MSDIEMNPSIGEVQQTYNFTDLKVIFHTDQGFDISITIPLTTLATVAPVVGYRMNDKTRIKELINHGSSYTKGTLTKWSINDEVIEIIDAYTTLYKSIGIGILRTAIEPIEGDNDDE